MSGIEMGVNPEAMKANAAENAAKFKGELIRIPEGETNMGPAKRIAAIVRELEGQES